jgi:hypothetical protein
MQPGLQDVPAIGYCWLAAGWRKRLQELQLQ